MMLRAARPTLLLFTALLAIGGLPATHGYWQQECGGDPPGGWALPAKKPLDCALRKLALQRAPGIAKRTTAALRSRLLSP